jgi:hypothetical protein
MTVMAQASWGGAIPGASLKADSTLVMTKIKERQDDAPESASLQNISHPTFSATC